MKQNLGRMLLAANLIDEVQMGIALEEQKRTGKKFGSTLVDLQFIDENVLAAFLSKQIDIPCISLLNIEIPRKLLRRVPAKVARECQAIPIRAEGNQLEMAMHDPTDLDAIQKLESATGMTVLPLIAPQSSIEKVIHRLYPDDEAEADDTIATDQTSSGSAKATDPMFIDLIEEIENTDLDYRLARIETGMNEMWLLLEKVLRLLEGRQGSGGGGEPD